jgi:hypothetical protein
MFYSLSLNGVFLNDPAGSASKLIFNGFCFVVVILGAGSDDGGSAGLVGSLVDGLVISRKPAFASSSAGKTVNGFV